MALAFFRLGRLRSRLTCAASSFTSASALISAGAIFSVEILKCCSDRCVCAPHSSSAGTSMGPKVSFSLRVAIAASAVRALHNAVAALRQAACSFLGPRAVPPYLRRMLRQTTARASAFSRLLAWSADAGLVCALTAACIAATLHLADVRYAFDFVRDTAPLWCALLALFSVAWPWSFTALPGPTPR